MINQKLITLPKREEIDATIRTECRTQMTHELIEAYGLHRYMYTIPMASGKIFYLLRNP